MVCDTDYGHAPCKEEGGEGGGHPPLPPSDYAHADDFYYDHWDDFVDFEDAEDYYDAHN